jgi:hypothetical protein
MTSFVSSIQEYITIVSKNQLMWYMEQNKTTEEEQDYYASEDYELHLTYLIETWVSTIRTEFNNNADLIDISKLFDDGYYWPEFNSEWLDDIFVRQILVTNVYLK